jgi:hypothetical protein
MCCNRAVGGTFISIITSIQSVSLAVHFVCFNTQLSSLDPLPGSVPFSHFYIEIDIVIRRLASDTVLNDYSKSHFL